jgi:Fe-Mn family superoxide dismutase
VNKIATTLQSLASGVPAPIDGEFLLDSLPYGVTDMEPVIDAETMALHHEKHHRAYVDGLNAALKSAPNLAGRALDDVLAQSTSAPAEVRAAIHNMGGGHLNHAFFWQCMSPRRGGAIPASLSREINSAFGSVNAFMQGFKAAGTRQFGSGWVSLCVTQGPAPHLEIATFANQDTWVGSPRRALLTCDVWEHAYYLKYRNRRADWLDQWWQVVDWHAVEARLESFVQHRLPAASATAGAGRP